MNLFDDFEVFPLGDQAILIRWEQLPSDSLLDHLLLQKAILIEALNIEVIHTYNELLLKITPDLFTEIQLRKLLKGKRTLSPRKIIKYEIPVCYGGKFGADLNAFAKAKQLSPDVIVALHTQQTYRLYFMGFLPGFLYLEGLDKRLHCPRKSTPGLQMIPGSVAIGGTQTGIYPQKSPGGWHCIGRTPVALFDSTATSPSPFSAGDVIQFMSVSESMFSKIESDIESGVYQIKQTKIEA